MITAITFWIFNRPENFQKSGVNFIDTYLWLAASLITLAIDAGIACFIWNNVG